MKIQIKDVSGTVLFEHTQADNTHVKTIEEAFRQNVDLDRAVLSYMDLRGLNLTPIERPGITGNYRTGKLRGAIFDGSNLDDADLRGIHALGASFRDVSLNRAQMDGAMISEAVFQGVQASAASLTEAQMYETTFKDCNFADMQASMSVMVGTKWINCSMPGAELSASDLTDAQMSGCNLDEAQLVRACMEQARLLACSAIAADFRDAEMVNAEFHGVNLSRVSLAGAHWSHAYFDTSPTPEQKQANLAQISSIAESAASRTLHNAMHPAVITQGLQQAGGPHIEQPTQVEQSDEPRRDRPRYIN